MKRRQFMILTGVGAAGTTLLSACGHQENKLIPALIPDDEYVPGLDYWKASTCRMCPSACGILVRTREHKANKIEGNPLHPVNRGALCARGQAGLQVIYNPDRIRTPLRQTGERGSSGFQEISWDDAIKALASRLGETKSRGRALFATRDPGGVTGLAAELLAATYGPMQLAAQAHPGESVTVKSYAESYGRDQVPVFDIGNARYLLSFGARFLETWHSPVMYSLAYSQFRRGGAHPRGKLVQIEPRMSLTGANADEWLPAAPGTEGLVALAMAQVIIRERLIPTAAPPGFIREPLDSFAPERTADATGIPADKVIRIAREAAQSQPALAIGGGTAASATGGMESMRAINFLNALVGNIGKPGGVLPQGESFDPLASARPRVKAEWLPFLEQMRAGAAPAALLVHGVNPVFAAPHLADKIKAIPLIASFSSFMDETTALADLILPDNSFLEMWDIGAAYSSNGPVVGLTRPVVDLQCSTRQTADVLLGVRSEMGDKAPLPFQTAEDAVKLAAEELRKQHGSIESEKPEDFWNAFIERGVWTGHEPAKTASAETGHATAAKPADRQNRPAASRPGSAAQIASDAAQSDYPFVLIAYEHPALGLGDNANLPWLQELPDPMTSVIWGSWVEINPAAAASLGIGDGDLVEIQTVHGTARMPAVLYPAIRPDVVAVPHGQGHTAYGMYAAGRGANAAVLDPSLTSPPAEPATVRAKVSKAGGEGDLIRFGTSLPERPVTSR